MTEERLEVYCHECGDRLELGEVMKMGKTGLHCIFCGAHLGYISDLPDKVRRFFNG